MIPVWQNAIIYKLIPIVCQLNMEGQVVVERGTFPVKFGKADEFIEIIRQIKSWYDERNITIRLYTAYHSTYDVVYMETEFDSLAVAEKYAEEFWADPWIQPFLPKWFEIAERGRTGETFVLHKL